VERISRQPQRPPARIFAWLRDPTHFNRNITKLKEETAHIMTAKKTTKSSKSVTTTASTQAPAPAASTVNSTAGQAPSPQASQASTAASPMPLVTSVANGSNTGRKTDLQTAYSALIAGLQAGYAPDYVFQLATGDQRCDDVVAELQKYVTAAQATKSSNQAWRNNVQIERQVAAEVAPTRAAVQSVLQGRYGKGSTQLLAYGFTPQKVAERTAASKAGAAVKTKATRTARGTKGSKQKLEITGGVTGVIITPVTSSQTPATPAAEPAPAAAAGAPAAAAPAAASKPTTA
jgi:hypothetical protein